MEFTVTEVRDFMVIKPVGRIDWDGARLLDNEVQRLTDGGRLRVVFNLDEVTFICSSGIGAFVYSRNRIEKLGGAVYIVADNEYISYIFEAFKFDVIFDGHVYKTFDEFSASVLNAPDKKPEPEGA
jgi:anti-anti-sigma factor